MYDVLTTAAMVDELSETIAGARIQRVGLRDRQTVVIECYAHRARNWLVATLGGREPVCYLASSEVGIDAALITPFSLLLRKYLRGAVVAAIDQPPLERIVRLSISKAIRDQNGKGDVRPDTPLLPAEQSNDEGVEEWEEDVHIVDTTLHIELMGRRGNIILVGEDGSILDSLKRVNTAMSRVRPILPRVPYTLPPTGDRLDPRSVDADQISGIVSVCDSSHTVASVLVARISALSPQIARECVSRVTGEATTTCGDLRPGSGDKIASEIRHLIGLLDHSAWEPTIYEDTGGRLVAYAAIPLGSLDQSLSARKAISMSAAVGLASAETLTIGRHAARRERIQNRVARERERVAARLEGLETQRAELEEADRYRRWGEAIYTHLWSIQPGQQELNVDGEVIPLDPSVEAKDQAQAYFQRYRKSGRGVELIGQTIDQTRNELAYLDQLATLLGVAETFDEIEALRREWEAIHSRATTAEEGGNRRKPSKKPPHPRPIVDRHGNRIYIGRSGPQNEVITFEIAGPDDYWLHARGVPGAHVIVRPPGTAVAVPDDVLAQAAAYAAWFSASRADSSVSVDICRRKDVRKLKGAGPGMVTYRNERTLFVKPASPEG